MIKNDGILSDNFSGKSPHQQIVLEIDAFGSVQHYYHFLLGFLAPLVVQIRKDRLDGLHSQFWVRSCGPMDKHLADLNYSNLHVLDSNDIENMTDTPYIFRKVTGFDHWDHYDKLIFNQVNAIVKSRLKKDLDQLAKINQPEVILINRAPADIFYSSELSEKKTSGLQRRSIPNFSELELAILKVYPQTYTLILENLTLAEQIIKFSGAKIIIAQHGAALANLIFANPGTKVVEIIPKNKLHLSKYFSELANVLEMDHKFSIQESNHSLVDVRGIIDTLALF